MKNSNRLALCLAIGWTAACAAGEPAGIPVQCSPELMICSSEVLPAADPVDGDLQDLLDDGVLAAPDGEWRAIYFYAPGIDDEVLKEMQQRFLEELIELGREAREAESVAAR